MNKNERSGSFVFIRVCLAVLSIAVFAGLSACGSAGGNPKIKITTPQAGLIAGDVTIAVNVSNFKLVSGNDSRKRFGNGKIIYYLDSTVPVYYDHSAIGKPGGYAISSEPQYVWKDVSPGAHTFSAQLVTEDLSPLEVPIIDHLKAEVGPPAGTPAIKVITPADASAQAPGMITMLVSVSNFIINPKDMGAVNLAGEGHLIFYIDEDPPVDAGVPATTDTSTVSTELRHLWKNVPEGKHTFAVQLVNNDDTPLDTPIVVKSNVEVKAAA